MLKKLMIVTAFALPISACASLTTGAQDNQAVYTAYAALIATQNGAIIYRGLPKCAPGAVFTVQVPCHDPAIVHKLRVDNDVASASLLPIYNSVKANPNGFNDISGLQAAQAAVAAFTTALTQAKGQ